MNSKEQSIISRLRMGHTGLNSTLHLIGKHPTGLCGCRVERETVEHVLCNCIKYEECRRKLRENLKNIGGGGMNVKNLLDGGERKYKLVIQFLKQSGLWNRI